MPGLFRFTSLFHPPNTLPPRQSLQRIAETRQVLLPDFTGTHVVEMVVVAVKRDAIKHGFTTRVTANHRTRIEPAYLRMPCLQLSLETLEPFKLLGHRCCRNRTIVHVLEQAFGECIRWQLRHVFEDIYRVPLGK